MTTHNTPFSMGDQIVHPDLGPGTVTFLGTEYVGVDFEETNRLFRITELQEDLAREPASLGPEEDLPWPEDTFLEEDEGTRHYLGSHWEAFTGEPNDILGRLSEIVPQSELMPIIPVNEVPDVWKPGVHMSWPKAEYGLMVSLAQERESMDLVSVYPFIGIGTPQEVMLAKVRVWKSGVEAQLNIDWNGAYLTFFDTQFLSNRNHYRRGRNIKVVLAGLAYHAEPATVVEFEVKRHPEEVEWVNKRILDDPLWKPTMTVRVDDMAALMPIDEWDVDDYFFRGPIKTVEPFTDFLGQDGWRIRTTVIRPDDMENDLDIWVTKRIWAGGDPPQPGQKITGKLWLQGYVVPE